MSSPSRLVSALGRIEGRSAIPGLAAGQDAMMIDGAHDGASATHPTIAERVAAIISVTGSMALIAPARRDTRPTGLSAKVGFGLRASPTFGTLRRARQGAKPALARVSSREFNRLGLTREMTVGAIAAVGVFLWMHSADLRNPAALVGALDPGSVQPLLALAGEQARCQRQGISWAIGVAAKPPDCNDFYKMLEAHSGDDGMVGKVARSMTEAPEGMYVVSPGTFTNVKPPAVRLAEVRAGRCFYTDNYSVGDRGLHSVTEKPSDDISLPRYLAYNDAAARNVTEAATPADRDLRLRDYFNVRKLMGETIHRFFGDPGLQIEAAQFAAPEHQAAIALLGERATDPNFTSKLSPLERAELELLTTAPQDFIPCIARRSQGQMKASAE